MAKATTSQDPIVLHISGPDQAGVTSSLTRILAQHQASLLDIGQTVLHGYLTLSALVEIPHGSDCLRELLQEISNRGMRFEVGKLGNQITPMDRNSGGLCVTMLGPPKKEAAISDITQLLADRNISIAELKCLNSGSLRGLELLAALPSGKAPSDSFLATLRNELFELASNNGIDVALQPDNLFRKNKRMVCMDVDSTFVDGEVIDILGELQGCGEEMARVTEQAMQGDLDFRQALESRVALLDGLSVEKAQKRLKDHRPSNEHKECVEAFRKLGMKVGVVSGGFDFFVNDLKDEYRLDFAFANKLAQSKGKFNGKLEGDIVDANRKAQILTHMAQAYELRLEQCVAIGDGSNDIPMLATAGLGIAFHAKAKVQEKADFRVNSSSLESIFYLMGFRSRDLEELKAL